MEPLKVNLYWLERRNSPVDNNIPYHWVKVPESETYEPTIINDRFKQACRDMKILFDQFANAPNACPLLDFRVCSTEVLVEKIFDAAELYK